MLMPGVLCQCSSWDSKTSSKESLQENELLGISTVFTCTLSSGHRQKVAGMLSVLRPTFLFMPVKQVLVDMNSGYYWWLIKSHSWRVHVWGGFLTMADSSRGLWGEGRIYTINFMPGWIIIGLRAYSSGQTPCKADLTWLQLFLLQPFCRAQDVWKVFWFALLSMETCWWRGSVELRTDRELTLAHCSSPHFILD